MYILYAIYSFSGLLLQETKHIYPSYYFFFSQIAFPKKQEVIYFVLGQE